MGKIHQCVWGYNKKIMILELNKSATSNTVKTSHLIFTTSQTIHIKHPSHTLHSDNW